MSVEVLNALKRILGRLPKTEFSAYDRPLDRAMNLLAAPEHEFKPDIIVTDEGIELPIAGFLYSIRADPEHAPVKVNFDRPVDKEYTVVFPGTIKQIGRLASKVYLKAPVGQKSLVRLEVLKLA